MFVGQGNDVGSVPVAGKTYGNSYLTGAGGQYILEQFAAPPFEVAGDLLVVRITGRPQDGEEQTREFLYRILPDRTLEEMAAYPPQVFATWASARSSPAEHDPLAGGAATSEERAVVRLELPLVVAERRPAGRQDDPTW